MKINCFVTYSIKDREPIETNFEKNAQKWKQRSQFCHIRSGKIYKN